MASDFGLSFFVYYVLFRYRAQMQSSKSMLSTKTARISLPNQCCLSSPLWMQGCSLPNQCCLSSPLRIRGHSLPNKCCLSSPLRMHRCRLPNQLTDAWTQSFLEKISYFEGGVAWSCTSAEWAAPKWQVGWLWRAGELSCVAVLFCWPPCRVGVVLVHIARIAW